MIALLRQVADPGTGEGARWASMRIHRIPATLMLELGHSSKLNAEWDVPDHAARRRAARGGRVSRRPCGRSRPGLLARSRRAAGGRLTGLGPSAAPPKA